MLERQSERAESREGSRAQQESAYRRVNAYTQRPSYQQILTILLFGGLVVLLSVFVTPAVPQQESPILWVLLGLNSFTLAFILLDYFYLTCTDPVDRMLQEEGYEVRPGERVRNCLECRHLVHFSSYHCHTCDRCVDQFDHHCKFLNNCIGGRNYKIFIRLLLTTTLFCLTSLGEAIWVFVLAIKDEKYQAKILSQWGVLTTLITSFLMLVVIDTLLFFHCYIVFRLETTTLNYLWDSQPGPANPSKEKMNAPDYLQFEVIVHQYE